MAKYTVRILKQGAAGLNGQTQLDVNAAGVTVNRSSVGLIDIVVPDGIDLGTIDPGQLAGRPNTTMKVTSFNVASDGGLPLAGDELQRRGINAPGLPAASAPAQTLDDLNASEGIVVDEFDFPPFQRLGFLVAQTGPHYIVMTMEG